MSGKLEQYYYKSLLIRRVEEKIEELFAQGKLLGTTHGYIGQEIIAAVLLDKINIKGDSVTGTHRSHGHYLALFNDPTALIAELMGKEGGVVKGKGGSQHLHQDNFYTNGITGGMVPVGTGIALSEKLAGSDNIVISFVGDGGMNEGYVFESFNFAVVKKLPILYVLENNQYAMSTSVKKMAAGDFTARLEALNMKTFEAITTSIEEVESASDTAIKYVRGRKEPALLHFKTYRFCGHSKSDSCEYRSTEEEEYWLERDILRQLKNKIGTEKASKIEEKVDKVIMEAVKKAEGFDYPDPLKIYKKGREKQ